MSVTDFLNFYFFYYFYFYSLISVEGNSDPMLIIFVVIVQLKPFDEASRGVSLPVFDSFGIE